MAIHHQTIFSNHEQLMVTYGLMFLPEELLMAYQLVQLVMLH